MIVVKKKTEDELRALTPARLKSYYRAEQKRLNKEKPICECCGQVFWKDKTYEEGWKEWHKYVMFVKAIMKTKEKE